MITIYTDLKLTRRQTICQVIDENYQLLYSANTLADCLKWAVDQGELHIAIDTGGQEFELTHGTKTWEQLCATNAKISV